MNHKKYWDKIHQKGPFCMVLSRNSPARWGGSLTLSGRNVRSQSMRCAIIDYTEQRLGSSHDVVSHSKRIIVYFPAALGFWSIRCWLAGEPVGFPTLDSHRCLRYWSKLASSSPFRPSLLSRVLPPQRQNALPADASLHPTVLAYHSATFIFGARAFNQWAITHYFKGDFVSLLAPFLIFEMLLF